MQCEVFIKLMQFVSGERNVSENTNTTGKVKKQDEKKNSHSIVKRSKSLASSKREENEPDL